MTAGVEEMYATHINPAPGELAGVTDTLLPEDAPGTVMGTSAVLLAAIDDHVIWAVWLIIAPKSCGSWTKVPACRAVVSEATCEDDLGIVILS